MIIAKKNAKKNIMIWKKQTPNKLYPLGKNHGGLHQSHPWNAATPMENTS